MGTEVSEVDFYSFMASFVKNIIFYFDFSKEKRFGCIAITSSRSWKMFDCRKRMPFICELKPGGPRRRKKFNRKCSVKRPNN